MAGMSWRKTISSSSGHPLPAAALARALLDNDVERGIEHATLGFTGQAIGEARGFRQAHVRGARQHPALGGFKRQMR